MFDETETKKHSDRDGTETHSGDKFERTKLDNSNTAVETTGREDSLRVDHSNAQRGGGERLRLGKKEVTDRVTIDIIMDRIDLI